PFVFDGSILYTKQPLSNPIDSNIELKVDYKGTSYEILLKFKIEVKSTSITPVVLQLFNIMYRNAVCIRTIKTYILVVNKTEPSINWKTLLLHFEISSEAKHADKSCRFCVVSLITCREY